MRVDAGNMAADAAPSSVDAGTSMEMMVDAGPTTSAGLTYEFFSQPGIPGVVGGPLEITVDSVAIYLENVRAIGDSASGTGDTQLPSWTLDWGAGSREEIRFDRAPPGRYSLLRSEIKSYEIRGSVTRDDDPEPFIIRENNTLLDVSVDLGGVMLEVGMAGRVDVGVGLDELLLSVPWSQIESVDDDGAEILIDSSSPLIGNIRNKMTQMFVLLP